MTHHHHQHNNLLGMSDKPPAYESRAQLEPVRYPLISSSFSGYLQPGHCAMGPPVPPPTVYHGNVPPTVAVAVAACEPPRYSSSCCGRTSLESGIQLKMIEFLKPNLTTEIGIFVTSIHRCVVVCFIDPSSTLATTSLQVGDQLVEVNGKPVSGSTTRKLKDFFNLRRTGLLLVKCRHITTFPAAAATHHHPPNHLLFRPFHMVISLPKSPSGKLGLSINRGIITGVFTISPAQRTLLFERVIVEVNGQSVVSMTDNEIEALCAVSPHITTLTLLPLHVFGQMKLWEHAANS